jgi:hypothetical protein
MGAAVAPSVPSVSLDGAIRFVEDHPMPLVPLRFLLQEGKVRGLAESCETWMKDHVEAMAARDVETLVKVGNDLAHETELFWADTWADLNRDRPGDLEGLGRSVDGMFLRIGNLLSEILGSAIRFASGAGHQITGLEELERATAVLNSLRASIKENWPWTDKPWPPLNREMQQRSRQQLEGPGEDVTEILRRLKAGNPL